MNTKTLSIYDPAMCGSTGVCGPEWDPQLVRSGAPRGDRSGRGFPVHLTTTDPAAHIETTLTAEVPNLRVSRIDPAAETAAYRERILERSRPTLDAEGPALLEEDLRSPCTEEVADDAAGRQDAPALPQICGRSIGSGMNTRDVSSSRRGPRPIPWGPRPRPPAP